jgi:carboxymethylenebutenolidase
MKPLTQCLLLLVVVVVAIGLGAENTSAAPEGSHFIRLKESDGREIRAFVAGPADAKAGVLLVHDYLGISDATEHAVERLGGMGYLALAIDLYGGKSTTSHDEAVKLMESMDRNTVAAALQVGLNYLKQPGRKLATIGFSMGGREALNANLNDPDAVSATVMVYGFGFDAIETKQLQKLEGPVLVISGAEDNGALDAAIHFLSNMKDAKRACELFVYPGVDHGYAQPLFNGGKNFSLEAVRATWVVVDDFLREHLALPITKDAEPITIPMKSSLRLQGQPPSQTW